MVARLRNVSVSVKLCGVVAAFGLPLAVLLWFMVDGFNANIRFATQETLGNRYQRALMPLLEELHDFGLAAQGKGGVSLAGVAGRIDTAFAALQQVDAQVGAALQFTDTGLALRKREAARASAMEARWRGLRSSAQSRAPADVVAQTHALIADVRTAITHAGDTSNLILDPDLDSYYLMDVTLLALPQTMDRLGDMAEAGASALGKDTMSAEDGVRMAVFAALLREADLARVDGSISTAINEDGQFYGTLPSLQRDVPVALAAYRAANERVLAHLDRMAAGEVPVTAQVFVDDVQKARREADKLWAVSVDALDSLLAARMDAFRADRLRALALAGGAIVMALGLSLLLLRVVTQPLRQLAAYTRTVADGHHSAPLQGTYSGDYAGFAASLRDMVLALNSKIAEAEVLAAEAAREGARAQEALREADVARREADEATREGMHTAAERLGAVVASVTAAATQLAAQVEQVRSGAMTQADLLHRTRSVLADLGNMTVDVHVKAEAATQGTHAASSRAGDGAATVNDSVLAIARVREQAATLSESMGELGRRASEIGTVMDVIGDIADQTNLLALNAAIEAARAGEAGRGFAVVADEVRKLAEKTMTATREVGLAIRAIQEGTRQNVAAVESSVVGVNEATERVQASGQVLGDIVTIVEGAAAEAQAIATATTVQRAAGERVGSVVEEVERVSAETREGMDHARDAVADLARQAKELERVIADLRSA